VSSAESARERLLAYRRSQTRAPHLTRQNVRVRGLSFAVWSTPAVPGTRPLVCVNGGLIYPHDIFWPALSPLGQKRQLVFYDQRGRGETEPPADPLTARIEHDADDVLDLRIALGFKDWDVLGHSWGAGIALLAAERDREGIHRLVVVDSVGPTSDWLAGIHGRAIARLEPSERAVLQRLDPAALTAPDPALHSAYSRAIYPAWFAHPDLARTFPAPRSESLTGAAVAARLHREGYNWRRHVCAIPARTFVIHGENDLILCATSHELSSLIAQARLELIPDCGHMPFWEAPETFFNAVDSFLASP
jgi:proline iminopeptidase